MQVLLAMTVVSLSKVRSFTLSEQRKSSSCHPSSLFCRTVSYYLVAAFYTFYSEKKKKKR